MADDMPRHAPARRESNASPTGSGPGGRQRWVIAAAWVLGGQGVAALLHSALGAWLATLAGAVALGIVVAMVAAVLAGGGPGERVFRLLRLLLGRREPPRGGDGST
jgi:hypothetical protein